jgi:hypothetical protein
MALCPQCGAARVNRYCAQCGSTIGLASPTQKAVPRASAQGHDVGRRKKSPVGFLLFLAMTLAGLVYFRAASPALPTPLSSTSVDAATIGVPLEQDRGAMRVLENRLLSLRSDLDHLSAERGDVLNLRQRLSQAKLQAEYEGRWPTKAVGRFFDRAQLKEMIDRTDGWLSECTRGMNAASEQINRLSIATGQAERISLQLQRAQAEAHRGLAMGTDEDAFVRGKHREMDRLRQDFSSVVNDPNLRAAHIVLKPFELDGD